MQTDGSDKEELKMVLFSFTILSIVGCTDDGSKEPPVDSDNVVVLDLDGDGYESESDYDDSNPLY